MCVAVFPQSKIVNCSRTATRRKIMAKHFWAVISLSVIAFGTFASAQNELVISEYIEGSSNNKAIELCNPSSSDVNLSTESYVLQVYANGASTPFSTIALTGTVPAGGSFVLANPSAASGILTKADQTSGSVTFNGDDAVVLRKGGATGTVADSYGQVGVQTDFGTNKTYRKKSCGIRDVVTTDAFDRTVQYDEFAVDTFDGLKSCPSGCGQSSAAPTGLQSSIPTPAPTASPTSGAFLTIQPTRSPTSLPTIQPTASPTAPPTRLPNIQPTKSPTSLRPTARPTRVPTLRPPAEPTRAPTLQPTAEPTRVTTRQPTAKPNRLPSKGPTRAPTKRPTRAPTKRPTRAPSKRPTRAPTKRTTRAPTKRPTRAPAP